MKITITFFTILSFSFCTAAQELRTEKALELYNTLAARQFDLIAQGDTSEIGDAKWGTHKLKDMYPTAKYGYYTAISKGIIHELRKDLAKHPKDLSEILTFLEEAYRKKFPKLPDSFYTDVKKQVKQLK
ncbi:hypothetical protein BWI96_19640 [Siphonobacter sp. SORGH_AS_0500]|uniref:hypothetical protein n=1 Tax=Siphonobacter sp. SORGH_AS_0500 TaxID=1864824 RepID=UPI000CB346E9|nr:hypothetical protein [Siphonobacter sp. SORGH_AS_0500]PKK34934.1 hypothetical protein BWI96_19640 [Siphonobacter sp. SORGH_AS_0500]